MRILLTQDQEKTMLSASGMVMTDGGRPYYFFPYFFMEIGRGVYDQLTWDELPEQIKDQILRIRGIKLPTINEDSTNGNPDMR